MNKGITIKAPGATKKTEYKTTKKPKMKYINKDNKLDALRDLLDPSKIAILQHPAQDTYWIGAKDSGKSRPVFAAIVVELESDTSSYSWILKKFKGNAADRAHANIASIAQELKIKGWGVKKYEKGQSETFKMSRKKKTDNQSITYSSSDNYDTLAGMTGPNNGKIPIIAFEEVASITGASPEEVDRWDTSIDMIKASVARINRTYQMVNRKNADVTKYHYMTNNWDDHPVLDMAERVFPIKEWQDFVKKDIINNNIMAKHDKFNDRLFVRNSSFNNPVLRAIEIHLDKHGITDMASYELNKHKIDFKAPELIEFFLGEHQFVYHLKEYKSSILSICKQAIANPKSQHSQRMLGTYLGFNYKNTVGVNKTYPNHDDIVFGDTWKMLSYADNNAGLRMAIDVDENRRFVLTGSTVINKVDYRTGAKISNLITFPQVTIKAHGQMDNVEIKESYITQICKEVNRMYIKFNREAKENKFAPSLTIDENHSAWVPYIKQKMNISVKKVRGKQSNDYNILKRQKYLNHFIDMSSLVIDKQNILLKKDIIKSVKKIGQAQRDESGSRNKFYDYLNSFEYSIKTLIKSTVNITHVGKEYQYYG